jgi:hypothetical protein
LALAKSKERLAKESGVADLSVMPRENPRVNVDGVRRPLEYASEPGVSSMWLEANEDVPRPRGHKTIKGAKRALEEEAVAAAKKRKAKKPAVVEVVSGSEAEEGETERASVPKFQGKKERVMATLVATSRAQELAKEAQKMTVAAAKAQKAAEDLRLSGLTSVDRLRRAPSAPAPAPKVPAPARARRAGRCLPLLMCLWWMCLFLPLFLLVWFPLFPWLLLLVPLLLLFPLLLLSGKRSCSS